MGKVTTKLFLIFLPSTAKMYIRRHNRLSLLPWVVASEEEFKLPVRTPRQINAIYQCFFSIFFLLIALRIGV